MALRMKATGQKLRTVAKYARWMLSLEPNQSPLLFHGLLCFLWRLSDFVPGHVGFAARWLVGKYRLGKLGRYPRIRSHNTFFDGRNVEIGDRFNSGKYNYFAGGPIRIGDRVSIGNYVIIETTGHLVDDLTRPIREQGTHSRRVLIGDDVWIGDRVTILGGVTIGNGAVIGAGAVVPRDIPPYSVAVGNPARVIRRRGDKSNQFALSAVDPSPRDEHLV